MKKYEAQEKYDKVNTIHVGLKFNKKTDKDIIERLESEDSKQTFIKGCIRKEIKNEKRRKK